MPRARSSTALASVAAIAGDEAPRPMPDRASDPTKIRSDEPGATAARATIEATTKAEPTTADVRSPIRTAMYPRSEEHTSELQSLMRISYAVFCLKKKNNNSH